MIATALTQPNVPKSLTSSDDVAKPTLADGGGDLPAKFDILLTRVNSKKDGGGPVFVLFSAIENLAEQKTMTSAFPSNLCIPENVGPVQTSDISDDIDLDWTEGSRKTASFALNLWTMQHSTLRK